MYMCFYSKGNLSFLDSQTTSLRNMVYSQVISMLLTSYITLVYIYINMYMHVTKPNRRFSVPSSTQVAASASATVVTQIYFNFQNYTSFPLSKVVGTYPHFRNNFPLTQKYDHITWFVYIYT